MRYARKGEAEREEARQILEELRASLPTRFRPERPPRD
jgi:hypothetical protein